MTDKVQKIKDWISKEQDGLMDAQGNFEYPEHEGAYHILCNLDAYIDSLQEEPKPKFKIGDMVVSESGKYAKIESIDTDKYWCNGENGMSIPFKYQDKWKLVEEPVSEELEEAARSYSNKLENIYGSIGEQTRNAFKDGAKWQEEKDNEEKVLTYRHGFNDCKEHIEKVLLSEVLPCFMHGGEADEVVAKLDEVLNQKK